MSSYYDIGCDKFYIREGLVVKSKRALKYGFDLGKYIKFELDAWHVPYNDICTDSAKTDFPVRFDATAHLQYFNGTSWVTTGALTAVPTLQQVTDAGNTTTNNITVLSVVANSGLVVNNSSFQDTISTVTLTGSHILRLPDNAGIFALSVNSNTPDLKGNITTIMTITTPTTGGTVNLMANGYNVIKPAGTLANLTLNFPATPTDREIVEVKTTQVITAVAYTGGTVVTAATTLPIGYTKFQYDLATTSWY